MDLSAFIRDIPDFPKEGIIFKDVTPMLSDPNAFGNCILCMKELSEDLRPTVVVAPEARGFIFAAPLALAMGIGFVPVRKPGKLPFKTLSVSYSLEYGTAELEMHVDALKPKDRVLIVDDILATGGTIEALIKMINDLKADVAGIVALAELSFLEPRERLSNYEVRTLISY